MSVATDTTTDISKFVSRLERKFSELHGENQEANLNVNRAGRAILKRNAGKTLSEARRIEEAFYSLDPPMVHQNGAADDYECAFLIATLYCSLKGRKGGQLADELRFLAEKDGMSTDGLRRRMVSLLDCRSNEELAFRLRQVTKLLASKKRGLDWRRLFEDLTNWYHPDRYVQRRWANAFFRTKDLKAEDTPKGTEE